MKRIIVIVIVFILMASIFVITLNSNRPHENDVQVSLCKAHVYSNPDLTNGEILDTIHEGDTFTLTGKAKTSGNGKGASYSMWEGVTADGTIGWVKANAFTETDKYGY